MKFEFGDLYKFIVSIGVVLISLSILVPWLFLKEPFDLFKTEVELKAVTEIARSAIISRQESVAFLLCFIPWFSAIGSFLGLLLIYLGLKRWYANQLLLDEQVKLEVEIKKQSLRDATSDEIAEGMEKDFEAQEIEDSVVKDYRFTSFRSDGLKLASQVAERLNELYGSKYEIELNKMVAGVEIDLILRGKARFVKDVLIEVKPIRKGFNFGWLRETFLKNVYAKNIYSQVTGRIPNTLLLIIADFHVTEKYASLLAQLSGEEYARKGKDRVVMLSKEELQDLSARDLQGRLNIYA